MCKLSKWILVGFSGTIVGFIALFMIFPNPLGVTDSSTISRANEFGVLESLKVQKHIEKFSQCPLSLSEWSNNSRLPEYQYEVSIPKGGKPSKSIPLWYKCNEDLTFILWVRHSIDSDIFISGGKNNSIEIKYGHFTDRQKLELTTNMSEATIKLKLREVDILR